MSLNTLWITILVLNKRMARASYLVIHMCAGRVATNLYMRQPRFGRCDNYLG